MDDIAMLHNRCDELERRCTELRERNRQLRAQANRKWVRTRIAREGITISVENAAASVVSLGYHSAQELRRDLFRAEV